MLKLLGIWKEVFMLGKIFHQNVINKTRAPTFVKLSQIKLEGFDKQIAHKSKGTTYLDWRRYSPSKMAKLFVEFFSGIDIHLRDVDEINDRITTAICLGLNELVPKRTANLAGKNPVINGKIRNLRNKKSRLHKKWKLTYASTSELFRTWILKTHSWNFLKKSIIFFKNWITQKVFVLMEKMNVFYAPWIFSELHTKFHSILRPWGFIPFLFNTVGMYRLSPKYAMKMLKLEKRTIM